MILESYCLNNNTNTKGNKNKININNEEILKTKLIKEGITQKQVEELIEILKVEQQDTENRVLGTEVTSWGNDVKTVGLGFLSNLIFKIWYGV